MSQFDYLVAFVSILVGLAIADLATSLHRLLRARSRVRWHWIPLLSALTVLLLVGNFWWQFRPLRDASIWSHFPAFLVILANLLSLFLLASAVLPDEVPAEGIDLERYYYDNRLYIWGLYALLQLMSVAMQMVPVVAEALPGGWRPDAAFFLRLLVQSALIALFLSLGRVRSHAYHAVVVPVIFLLVLVQVSRLRLL